MGNIVLTGNAGPNDQGNHEGLTIENGAIENFVGAGPTHAAEYANLASVQLTCDTHEGFTLAATLSLLFQNIIAGTDLTSVCPVTT